MRAGWAAKAAFGALLLYGALRVVDPEARWAEARVPGDVVEHALLVYALLTCALAAFPRLSLTVGASAMLLLGLSVEVAQALPGVPGGFQLRDLASDLVGVLLAAAPFLIGRARTVADRAGEAPRAAVSNGELSSLFARTSIKSRTR